MNPTHLRGPRTAQRALPGPDRRVAQLLNFKGLRFSRLLNSKILTVWRNLAYRSCQHIHKVRKYNGVGARSPSYGSA